MSTTIEVKVYTNGDDAFVAWKPSAFIPDCRGFMLERESKEQSGIKAAEVENRTGFARDKAKSGDHRPSSVWPFQRFNWTDHALDVGSKVRYRVTAMLSTGEGKPFAKGPSSGWTAWATMTTKADDKMSCYFNRGLVLSQFVARYMRAKELSPKQFKDSLKKNADPKFRAFLEGDLGARMDELLADAAKGKVDLHAALYELDDAILQGEMIKARKHLHVVLANGSDKKGDGNKKARTAIKAGGVPVIDRLLGSKGLGHNKFVAISEGGKPSAVWTGSTNWATTGLCTQINNGLLIEDAHVAQAYLDQWNRLASASPPKLKPANFPPALVGANDQPKKFTVGKSNVAVWFTRTSDGRDMKVLRKLIDDARSSIHFLMFTPGKDGLHIPAAQRATEKKMYVRGVVSTLGNAKGDGNKNYLDIKLVGGSKNFKPDRYTVVQPQGQGKPIGPWIGEVTRPTFLSQIGHAIVHTKCLLIDALTDHPVLVTGSHNLSTPASRKNDENFVVIHGNKKLAIAYATYIMSVYQHYRYRSYVREMLAKGQKPWAYLDDDDKWLKNELVTKQAEIEFWTQ